MPSALYTGCSTAFIDQGVSKIWQRGQVQAVGGAYSDRLSAMQWLRIIAQPAAFALGGSNANPSDKVVLSAFVNTSSNTNPSDTVNFGVFALGGSNANPSDKVVLSTFVNASSNTNPSDTVNFGAFVNASTNDKATTS